MITHSISFSAFCTELGAPLKNIRNSWCGYAKDRSRSVFTVWADELTDGRYVFWRGHGHPAQSRPGATDMHGAILTILERTKSSEGRNSEALGILCYAKDVEASPRVRESFDRDFLLVLRFVEESGDLVAYVQGRVSVAEALRSPAIHIEAVPYAIADLDAPPPGTDLPLRTSGMSQGYVRNQKVRDWVVKQADGCEYCGTKDFLMPTGNAYLEAHHIIGLAKQGPDAVDNVIAVCASHHREAHYGANADELETRFLEVIRQRMARQA